MEDVNRQMVKEECPSFYTEKVKEPKKQPLLIELVRTVTSVFKNR